MSTVVRAEVPSEEFALHETFEAAPDVSFECERIIQSGGRIVMPLVWSYGADRETIDRALADDPTVDDASLVTAAGDDLLYRMEWIQRVQFVLQMLTTSRATVLDSYGNGDTWTLRMLYPDRESLAETKEFCDDRGFGFEMQSVQELDGEPGGRFGLTPRQYEALAVAHDAGYFEVPRQTSLGELADRLDITHQALSERLRRAHRSLVRETVLVD